MKIVLQEQGRPGRLGRPETKALSHRPLEPPQPQWRRWQQWLRLLQPAGRTLKCSLQLCGCQAAIAGKGVVDSKTGRIHLKISTGKTEWKKPSQSGRHHSLYYIHTQV